MSAQRNGQRAWIAACGLALCAAGGARAQGPIAEPLALGTTAVELVDVVQVPPSSPVRPNARINLLTHAGDGSGRLFVNDMVGRIWVIEGEAVLPTPFLDVQAALPGILDTRPLQRGLVTFAFHPDYAKPGAPGEGRLYTTTSERPGIADYGGPPDYVHPLLVVDHLAVLSEWRVDPDDPDRVDPGSRRVLLRTVQPSGDHTMSQIAFDPYLDESHPDYGMLYVAIGDGGGYLPQLGDEVDPEKVAQDTGNPFGSILRIDPLGTSEPQRPTNGGYGIPADNPLAGRPGAAGEIFAWGFRNPHRFSWDPGGRGAFLVSDIGQSQLEEIDWVERGANHGWSEREGTTVLDPLDPTRFLPLPRGDPAQDFRYPVAQYDHDEGFAIVGGFVARGGGVPALEGRYVFGDNNGRIFHAAVDELTRRATPSLRVGKSLARRAPIEELRLFHRGVERSLLEILGEPRRADLRFGLGPQGEIYVLTKRDGMVRVIRALACDDGLDDDGDGLADLRDPECSGIDDPDEACGLGFELALLLPALQRLRRRRDRARRAQSGSPRPIRSTKLS